MRAFTLATFLILVGCAPDAVVTSAALADADTAPATDTVVVTSPDVPDATTASDVPLDPCLAQDCDDHNACTTDTCLTGTCQHIHNTGPCDDGNVCTVGDVCAAGTCVGLAIDCTGVCGNTLCDAEETPLTCPGDCSWLWQRLHGLCAAPGSHEGCPHGFVCVARSAVGGGNVCVSDMRSWLPLPDARTPTDFVADGETVHDTATGLQWPKVQLANQTWQEAGSICTAQSYNGLHDWRLPTETELMTLVDIDKVSPSSGAPVEWPAAYNWFWSATPSTSASTAWLVLFTFGYTGIYTKDFPFSVRCVRGGVTAGTGGGSRFAVSDDGLTVFDHATGLRWQRVVAGSHEAAQLPVDWAKIIAGLPGSGWRLPSRDELLTLIDRQFAGPAVDPSIFPNKSMAKVFSASPSTLGNGPWCVSFDKGISDGGASHATVRAVATYPCNATTCDDGNPCTTDACPMGTCKHIPHPGTCDDGDTCTTNDACFSGSCLGQPGGCAILCGNGVCDGHETPVTCASDCSWLWQRLGGACGTPGAKDVCSHGYVCVGRASVAGGNVCVSDLLSWLPLPDTRSPTDFSDDGATVTDKVTGLQWAKALLPAMDWPTALSACTTQTYGGANDWRLPTETELLTLTDLSHPALAQSIAGAIWPMMDPESNFLWSAMPIWAYSVWCVGFPNGDGQACPITGNKPRRVGCVRGGTAVGTGSGSRFAVSAATVFDHATGLRWQRTTTQLTPSWTAWQEAKDLCAQYQWGTPGAGWRLPTRDELLTLVDRQVWHPAIDATAFPATPMDTFWTASPTAGSAGYPYFGTVDFYVGWAVSSASFADAVRCVR